MASPSQPHRQSSFHVSQSGIESILYAYAEEEKTHEAEKEAKDAAIDSNVTSALDLQNILEEAKRESL